MPAPTKTVLLILAGPAGVGKSTLCDRLVAEVPGFERVITATTRPPRPNEQNGRDYHFLSEAEFDARLAAQGGDDGTNDLIVSDVIRRNELQVWFVAEHVVDTPLTQAV